jgi:hypothetical protein
MLLKISQLKNLYTNFLFNLYIVIFIKYDWIYFNNIFHYDYFIYNNKALIFPLKNEE